MKGAGLGSDLAKEQEDEIEVDLSLLSEKEKNKIIKPKSKGC